jgi:uncharacterized membrane protein YfcA
MEIIGYACAVLVGIALGLLGGGGSLLTVPVMVYLLHISPVDATGYSLFVVGVTSAIGCAPYIGKKLINAKLAAIFGVPSIICVFLTRKFLVPLIPNPVISTSTLVLTKDLFILILFALFMIAAALSMIRKAGYKEHDESELHHMNYGWLFFIGFISGIITGVLGVGGGFIIIPALVLLGRIPIRMSVGTSLLIIAFNALSGFAGELIEKHEIMNYGFLILFTLLSVIGILIGFRLTLKLNPAQLKRIFGWFVLVMGGFILVKEIFLR